MLKADGQSFQTIADKLGVTVKTVQLCISKYKNGGIGETHKSSDFIEFLKILDKKYPSQDKIRVILDNHPAHTSKETRNFPAAMPEGRFEFVFTPKHGSWLNMAESFFNKMTKQMLRGIRVDSKQELIDRIYLYFQEINKEPVVYHWKYKMDEITEEEARVI